MKFPKLNKRGITQVALVGFALGVLYVAFIYFTTELPAAEDITNIAIAESTRLFDREGEVVFYEIYKDEKRTVIPAEEIPDVARQATLSMEDNSFYEHGAFDWRGLTRAVLVNLIRGRVTQGGSTITQQLAKNTFLTPERTITRKLREAVLALKLERRYAKDDILSLYLNQVPYGPTIYGIESASQAYFAKPANEININEAAMLAALPKAPSYYSPWGVHKDDLRNRKNFILGRMSELGYIDEQQLSEAGEELPEIQPQPEMGIRAPHFAITIQEYLRDKYGEEVLRTGGLRVITTLDWRMQEIAEQAVMENVTRNKEVAGGHNGALLAMDPKTGQVLAMVGSRDYFADPEPEGCDEGRDCAFEGNFNVPLQGLRQPGSSFKPFAYLTAFQQGFTPQSIIWDASTEFSVNCPPSCYSPINFDHRFRGPVTMAEGLAQSINVPSVKTLYLAGLERTMDNALKFGIKTFDDPNRFGLSLVLGGGEVRMIEMISAYSVLATEGTYHEPAFILRVEDSKGKVLEEYKDEGIRVVDVQYPRLVNDILSDVGLRSGLFTASLPLTQVPGYQVALKTGTTNDYVDAWTFGYTPNLVAGVWAGNNNRLPLGQEGSSLLAAIPMWHDFMSQALPELPVEYFNRPDPAVGSHPTLNGQLIEGEYHSILYYLGRQGDSQYPGWEAGIQFWLGINPPPTRFPTTKVGGEDTEGSVGNIDISFKSPQSGDQVGSSFTLKARIKSESDIEEIRVYLNDDLKATYSGNFGKHPALEEEITASGGLQGKLRISATDELGNSNEEGIIIFF
ncbi:MAG: transglycosylase domain-containing protein [Patescibacteria group bacterium]|nr:transglycosylase domain-containing protein [Patescibacteria group bacterium]